VEFGHMVLLCRSPEKFITDYNVPWQAMGLS
jgi:hypothetical protein